MADMSNYLEGAVGDHVLRNTAYTSPANVFMRLYTAVSDAEAGTGTEVSTSGTAYSGATITFGAGSNGVFANSSTVTFEVATGSGFGAVSHFCVRDAVSAGNALSVIKALAATKQVDAGDQLIFPASTITVTFA